jgi:flagellar protein FliJ
MNLLKEQKFVVEKEREELIEASKKKKTLEILKDKDYEEYKKEVEKAENEELNEIGTNMYLKKEKIY